VSSHLLEWFERRWRASPEQVACRRPSRFSRRRTRDGKLIPPTREDTPVHKPTHPSIVDNDGVDDIVLDAPALTIDDAVTWALRLFGVNANGSALPSERDQNFLLHTDNGERFVLKVANSGESRALLDAQNAALAHVGRRSTLCPSVVPT